MGRGWETRVGGLGLIWSLVDLGPHARDGEVPGAQVPVCGHPVLNGARKGVSMCPEASRWFHAGPAEALWAAHPCLATTLLASLLESTVLWQPSGQPSFPYQREAPGDLQLLGDQFSLTLIPS